MSAGARLCCEQAGDAAAASRNGFFESMVSGKGYASGGWRCSGEIGERVQKRVPGGWGGVVMMESVGAVGVEGKTVDGFQKLHVTATGE